MSESLAAVFWRHVRAPAPSAPASSAPASAAAAPPAPAEMDLETLLGELVATAQAAWPAVAQPAVDFVSHLGRLYDGATPVDQWLRRLRIGELYLTCACAAGQPEAIAAFDRRFIAQARRHIAHLRPSPALVDDVLSELREKLLLAPPGQTARIAEYAGLGPLDGGWLRVITMRVALDLLRRREPALASATVGDLPDTRTGNPELGFIQAQYRALFQECLTNAVQALPAEQRNLLRMHVVDGVTLEQLAQLFHISRATVVRRLAAARSLVLEAMRARVQTRVTLVADEFESLFGQLASQLDLSLSTVL